jgi:RNA polymerase sigma-70 factor (ECF subfamily)
MVNGKVTMTPEKTDEQLLSDFLAGDPAALAELALRYEPRLLGLALGLLAGQRDLACDAIQDTWLRVIRFGRQFTGRSRFRTWVYRIAVNQCRSLQELHSRGPGAPLLPTNAAAAAGPASAAEAADQNHVVRRAVERLDPDKRMVVLLCYHAGMTHEQAAEILELPLGTLKSRLHAALTELRSALSAAEATP